MRRRTLLPFSLVLAISFGCNDEAPTEATRRLAPERRSAVISTPITPTSGGVVTSPIVTIDNRAGLQTGAQVSGDLACYDDRSAGQVRYYRFSTGTSTPIATVGIDHQCSIFGNRIAFARVYGLQVGIHVFDVGTSSSIELDPQPTSTRYDPVIRSNTVAFFDYFFTAPQVYTSTALRVVDLLAPNQSQLLSSIGRVERNPNVSPDGNVIVWQTTDADGYGHIMKSVRSAGIWSAPQVVTSSQFCSEDFPDTDGSYIVWSSLCFDDEDSDVFFQPVTGGAVTRISISGEDYRATISGGVVAFGHAAPGASTYDVMVYTIATNTLLQVTNTPGVSEEFARVNVLSGGNVRVVWERWVQNENDVYGTTFTPTGGTPNPGPTYTFGGFSSQISTTGLNSVSANAVVSVRFSLGGDQGLGVFASGSPSSTPIDCKTLQPTGAAVPTLYPGKKMLSYDAASGIYTYNWKTDKLWAGTCRRLTLEFVNGVVATANFQFD